MQGLFIWRTRRIKKGVKKPNKNYEENKKLANEVVNIKLLKYKELYKNFGYDLTYNKVTIRNQNTRWGSCSSKKNLNFNYKIIFLPEHLIEYIIAHELCHLLEMNHGVNFWKLVELTIPEYHKCKKELSKIRLHNIGQINL